MHLQSEPEIIARRPFYEVGHFEHWMPEEFCIKPLGAIAWGDRRP